MSNKFDFKPSLKILVWISKQYSSIVFIEKLAFPASPAINDLSHTNGRTIGSNSLAFI